MAGFVERYSFFPGSDTLAEIEGVDIIDLGTPTQISGVGVGTVAVVGEFVKHQPEPIEVFSANELISYFGGYNPAVGDLSSYSIGSNKYMRWDGAAYPQLQTGMKYARLICVSVDDRVGTVDFVRANPGYGTLEAEDGPFNFGPYASPADLVVEPDSAPANRQTVTFTYTSADLVSSGGAFTGAIAGDRLYLQIGSQMYSKAIAGTETTIADYITTFSDPSAFPGVTFTNDGGQLSIETTQKGSGAYVGIGDLSTADLLTDLGFTTSDSASGTGNVANHLAVTAGEIKAACNAVATFGDYLSCTVVGSSFNIATLTAGASGSVQCILTSTDIEYALGADFLSISAIAGGTGSPGYLKIPAGSRVENNGSSTEFWLTMEDAIMEDGVLSAEDIPIRACRALDGVAGKIASHIDTIPQTTLDGMQYDSSDDIVDLAVDNPSVTTSRPSTEAEWAALYSDAVDKLKDSQAPIGEVNLVGIARTAATDGTATSGTIQALGKSIITDLVSDNGKGVTATVSPPLGTTKAVAKGSTGVGRGNSAIWDERINYAYPGVRLFIPSLVNINQNTDFGTTYPSDGMVDIPSNFSLLSLLSQLNPEMNPGMATQFLKFTALEASTKSGGTIGPLTKADYKSFKSNGIIAPRIDPDVGAIFQSGVTSDTTDGKTKISRRRYADFVQDSIAAALKPKAKELGTEENFNSAVAAVEEFLEAQKATDQPQFQRLKDYLVSTDANTDELNSAGIYVIEIKVQTLPSMDNFALVTEIGDTVTFAEV